jgi:FdhD protein
MSTDRSMEWVEYTKVNDDVVKAKERVVTEFGLSIRINGKHFTTNNITPMMEKEYTVGYLFGQGIIDNMDDIESLTVNGNIAEVTLSKNKNKIDQYPEICSDLKVQKEDIFAGVRAILKSRIYAETEAIHSAGLFIQGSEPICIAEDIGRHNALDKIIGYALIHKVDFSHTFAVSTGRMPSDMVLKICRAGIPIVATKTAATNMGIEIGKKCGLTIIGFVRESNLKAKTSAGMKIYTNPQRIFV